MRGKKGANKAVPIAPPVVEPLEQRRLLSIVPMTLATLDGPVAPRVAVDSAGNVFGTTLSSGTSAGSVFEIAAGTSTVETLATFGSDSSTNVDGIDPGNIVIDAAGNLFGGTAAGGTQADYTPSSGSTGGTLWELPHGDTALRVLQTFGHVTPYYDPALGVSSVALDAAGDVFASVGYRIEDWSLSIQEYIPALNATGYVADLSYKYDLTRPLSNFAVDPAGNTFVPVQPLGGGGSISSIPAGTAAANLAGATAPVGEKLASFDGLGSPEGVAFDAAGNAYINTVTGSIFEVPKGTSTPKLLASNTQVDQNPFSDVTYVGPVVDAAGDVFEVADNPSGGVFEATGKVAYNEYGSLLELPAGGSALRTLMTFDTAAEAQQVGGLTVDAAGDVFGTMPSGAGTAVFELPAAVLPTSGSALVPTVARSTLPTAVVTGRPVRGTVAVTLTNGGTATSTGATTVTLYAVAGASDSAVTPIARVTRRLTLRAGRSARVAVPVRGPVLPGGAYSVVARVTDAAGGTSTAADDRPLGVAAAHAAVSVGVTSVQPRAVTPGRMLLLTLAVVNGGNVAATGPAMIAVSLVADGSGPPVGVATVNRPLRVAAGGRAVPVRVAVRVPTAVPAGSYTVQVTLAFAGAPVTAAAGSAIEVG